MKRDRSEASANWSLQPKEEPTPSKPKRADRRTWSFTVGQAARLALVLIVAAWALRLAFDLLQVLLP